MSERDRTYLQDVGWVRAPKRTQPRRERPLTDLQKRVLIAMHELAKDDDGWHRRYAWSPNEIGSRAGAKRVEARGHGSHRVFGPAQQIIRTLTSLDRRGLIQLTGRDDGLSGVGYYLTTAGRGIAADLTVERER